MTIDTLSHIAGRLTQLAALVAGGSGLLLFRRRPWPQRWLALLAGFDVLMELTAAALVPVFHFKSNLFLIPFIAIGEVGLLALAYRGVLRSATYSRLMPWVVGLFSTYALLDGWTGFRLVHFSTGVQITADLLQLSLAGLYFWKLLQELRIERPLQEPFFWVSVGLLAFVLGDILIILFSNYLLAHYTRTLQMLVISLVRPCFLIFLYCCYSLALWMPPPKPNLSSF